MQLTDYWPTRICQRPRLVQVPTVYMARAAELFRRSVRTAWALHDAEAYCSESKEKQRTVHILRLLHRCPMSEITYLSPLIFSHLLICLVVLFSSNRLLPY